MNIINEALFSQESIKKYKEVFNSAQPYRHIVIENFLVKEVADSLVSNFPSIENFKKAYNGLNEKKSEDSSFDAFHPDFTHVRTALKSPAFCQWLSEVTGISDVFMTDDNLGSGLHQGSNGSFLDIHIDFNIHNRLNVHRRLNFLLYLNKDWQDDFGGYLEMWNTDVSECITSVAPLFNRVVVFETSDISYHGYSKITVPEHVTRKSFYGYYYTNEREGATKYHDTIFKAKPSESTGKKVATNLKESFKNFTKRQLKKVGIHI